MKSFTISRNLFRIELLNMIKSLTTFIKHYVIKFFTIAMIINTINFMAIFMRVFEIKFFIIPTITNMIAIIAIINVLKLLFKDKTKCSTYY